MIKTVTILFPLMITAAPAAAQSHAGHAPAAQVQAAPLPPGCVRRGAPNGDAARVGAPGAPVCPAGSVPERIQTPADPHAGHHMPGMSMGQAPATPPADPHAGHHMPGMDGVSNMDGDPPRAATSADPHAGHDMSGMSAEQAPATPPSDPHAGHSMPGMTGMVMPPDVPTSADDPGRPPQASPPVAATRGPAHAADLYFDPAEMTAARERLRVENGDVRTTAVIVDQLETASVDGETAYAWGAQGWTGGDVNRFWWKSEGEGAFGGEVEEAELQALYSRAVSPFFDVQAGVRQTYRPEGDRTDLVLGVQGLAPYWFEVGGAVFLSTQGELTARAEAEYDQRITNRWILQPRAEISLSAEDIPELSIGSGVTSLQLGARLRYEIRKEFAPYVGVEWTRSFGNTADYLKAAGRDVEDTRLVVGLRAWF